MVTNSDTSGISALVAKADRSGSSALVAKADKSGSSALVAKEDTSVSSALVAKADRSGSSALVTRPETIFNKSSISLRRPELSKSETEDDIVETATCCLGDNSTITNLSSRSRSFAYIGA